MTNGWDEGLDISTGSKQLYTNWEDCYEQLNHEDTRKAMRKHDVDIHLTERSDLASNSPLIWKPDGEPGPKKKIGKNILNDEIFTAEEPPPLLLLHAPMVME